MRYADATAYDLLWAEAVVVEEAALGGHVIAKAPGERRAAKAARTSKVTRPRAAGAPKRAPAKKAPAEKKTRKQG
jgi:hypothetical protein